MPGPSNTGGRKIVRTPKLPEQSEAQFQEAVVEYLKLNGWLVYHTHDSRHSAEGFPDITAVRDRELVFAELKKRGGRPTEAQQRWLRRLAEVGHLEHAMNVEPVRAYLWTPDDWPEIEAVMHRKRMR